MPTDVIRKNSKAMSEQVFRICTITNKPYQYAEMKASFLEAGFDENRCRYEVFDNAQANAYDPYRTISAVMEVATEPYVIFCHQDVLANKGDGFDKLLAGLEDLTQKDAKWAIAGNAGALENLTTIFNIDDPYGVANHDNFPERVYTLDENFLVLRTGTGLRTSKGLSGFHLYATDLCLQATRCGFSCYVINFHLTHLSGGSPESDDFQKALSKFIQHWNSYFTLCLIHTPCVFISLSRSRIIRRLLRSQKINGWIWSHMGVYMRITRARRAFSLK